YRGRSMANAIAGLFAGHLSGAAVGAMVMQQWDAHVVFWLASALMVLPMLGVLLLLGPYRRRPAAPYSAAVEPPASMEAARKLAAGGGAAKDHGELMARPAGRVRWWHLLYTRDYGLL